MLLGLEHDETNAGLLTEGEDVEGKLTENGSPILNRMSTLNDLVSGTAEMCWRAGLGVLTGTDSFHSRYEHPKAPADFSCELKK